MRRITLWAIDLLLVFVSCIAAIVLRNGYEMAPGLVVSVLPYVIASMLSWAVVSGVLGTSKSIWRYSSLSDYMQIVWASILTTTIAAGSIFFLNRLDSVARSIPFLHLLVMITALVGSRVAMRIRHARRGTQAPLQMVAAQADRKTVVVVGIGPLSELYLRSLQEVASDRVHVAGIIGRRHDQTGRVLLNTPILGTLENIETIIRDLTVHGVFVDEIIVAMSATSLKPAAREALQKLEMGNTINVRYLAEEIGLESYAAPSSRLTSVDVRSSQRVSVSIVDDKIVSASQRVYWSVKRIFDFVAALVLLAIFAPLLAFLALLVGIDVGFPVTFWQRRPGFGGRPFQCLKFRTMRPAHDAVGLLVPEAERVSWFCRLLRTSRFDELPQLFNILNGDMSLIGPRPLLPKDQPTDCARLLVRPGLTGWAQVCARRAESPADKAALDTWYILNASPFVDLRILSKTIKIVLLGERVDFDALNAARLLRAAPTLSAVSSGEERRLPLRAAS